VKVRWVGKVGHPDEAVGNFLGYAASNAMLLKHLAPLVELDDAADLAVTYGTPMDHEPSDGLSILFTMFESPEMPYQALVGLATADVIITPSKFCVELFRPHTNAPIYTCPLGVDVHLFKHRPRSWRPGQKFRWLYVGAPNPRKFTELTNLHQVLLSRWPGVELYIKTTGADVRKLPEILESGSAKEIEPGLLHGQGVTFDNRRLPVSELIELYHQSHGFLFLHCGEGFGLAGAEAMATGLPTVITDYSGSQEYADRANSFPVKLSGKKDRGYAWPDLQDAMRAVSEVMLDYPRALKIGKQAARDMRRFSWGASARKLVEILDRVTADRHRAIVPPSPTTSLGGLGT